MTTLSHQILPTAVKHSVVFGIAAAFSINVTVANAEFLKPAEATVSQKSSHYAIRMVRKPEDVTERRPSRCPEIFFNAIRSEAMIVALSCSQRDQYAQAVRSSVYRSSAISKHFASEQAHLNYTTDLANQQSLYDIRHYGKELCAERSNLLHDMQASIKEPDRYVTEHGIFVSGKNACRPR